MPLPPPAAKRPRSRLPWWLAVDACALAGATFAGLSVTVQSLQTEAHSNERCAIHMLRWIENEQLEASTRRFRDANNNGQGEHGLLADLVSRATSGSLGAELRPHHGSRYSYQGYVFEVFLPDHLSRGTTDKQRVDPAKAELFWSCHAVPVRHRSTGYRSFFVDARGYSVGTNGAAKPYDARRNPDWSAAYMPHINEPTMNSKVQECGTGRDGNDWIIVP